MREFNLGESFVVVKMFSSNIWKLDIITVICYCGKDRTKRTLSVLFMIAIKVCNGVSSQLNANGIEGVNVIGLCITTCMSYNKHHFCRVLCMCYICVHVSFF